MIDKRLGYLNVCKTKLKIVSIVSHKIRGNSLKFIVMSVVAWFADSLIPFSLFPTPNASPSWPSVIKDSSLVFRKTQKHNSPTATAAAGEQG